MTVARGLTYLAALSLAFTGVAYLLVPAAALSVVGIAADPTSEFLLRTEGVPLLTSAGLLIVIAIRPGRHLWLALLAVAGYLVVSSIIDLFAFRDGIVGQASVPSAIIRIVLGVACIAAAAREPRSAVEPDASS